VDIITGDSLKLRLFTVLVLLFLSINVAAANIPYFIDYDLNNVYMPIDIQAGVNKTYTIEKTAGYSPNGSGVFLAYHGLETSDYLDSATIPSTNIIYESRVRVDSAGLMYWGIGDNTNRNTGDHFLIGSYSANDKVYIYSINEGSTTYDSEAPAFSSGYHNIKITTNSGVDGYVDDNPISSGVSLTANENMGLQAITYNGGTFTQDYSFVRQYTASEPTYSIIDMGSFYQLVVSSTSTLSDYELLIDASELSISASDNSLLIQETTDPSISVSLTSPPNNSYVNSNILAYNISGIGDFNTTLYINSSLAWNGNATEGENQVTISLSEGLKSWYVNGSATYGINTTYNTSETWYFTYDSINPVTFSTDINPDYENVANGTIVQTNIQWSDTNLKNASFYVDYGSGYILNDSTTFSTSKEWFNTSIDTAGYTGEAISWYQIAYDEAGNSYTYSDSFSVVLNALNIYVYDETTSELILPSSVVIYNEDISKEATISESTKIASLSYDGLSSAKYIVRVSADDYYSRRSILYVDIESLAELNVYLPGENETVIFDQFSLTDNTGSYEEGDCIIRLDKPLVDGTDTVFSSYFDFDGVASTYLIATDQYILYIETPDKTVSYGWLSPDADGVIDIVLSDSPVDIVEDWLTYSFTHTDEGVITLAYESSLEIDSFDFWINATNGTNLYTASSSSDSGSFMYTGYNNSSYYAGFSALSTSGKTVSISRMITFTGSGVQDDMLNFLPEDAPDWLFNLIGGAIVVIAVLLFGEFRMDVGCVIGASLTGLFWYWGLLKITGIVVAVGVIIAVSAVMHRSRRS